MALKSSASSALSQPARLAVGFVILAMISGTSIWLVAQTRADSKQVIRTIEVKEKLSTLQGLIWRTESHQRAFLLTGAERYREAFRTSAEAVKRAMAESEAAMAGAIDQVVQGQLVADLKAAVTAELTDLEEVAARRQGGGLEALSSMPSDSLVQSRAEDIRNIIAQLVRQEQHLLAVQIDASQRTGQLLLVASLIGALLLIALAAVSVALVRRSTERLRAAHKVLEDTNESLEATVATRTAELRQANEEIRHFAHIVSHDLRSPLVNIMGFTGELEVVRERFFERLSSLRARLDDVSPEPDKQLGEEFNEALGFIKNSITRMDRLIKAILKLTREGRRELRMESIDMMELVRSAADALGYQAQEAGASITIGPLPPVVGDRLALEQIFSNLLENALKYLRGDTLGRIQVTGRSAANEVIYEVHDNGRGIDAKDRERIFDIFRRSGPRDRPGEGIGLTYVQTLVRRLGGDITVRSDLGQGSTFTVTLPCKAAIHPQEISP